jgi:hypothetical protein
MIRPVESLSYEYLFKYSPIALWEIDFTNVLIYLEKIKEKGIPDIKHHLELFPDEFDECFRLLKIKQANEAALNFLEIDSVEDLADNDNSFLTSKTRLAYLELINGLYQNKKSFNFDTEVLSKSGNRKAVRIKFNLIYTNNTAEHIGILTTEMLFDIRQQEEQFKETISISPDIIMINRISDGLFSYVNHTFKSKTGYSDEEIYHKSGLDLGFWVKQEERKIYFEAMNREGFVQDLPTTFRAKNGEQIEGLLSARQTNYQGEPQIIATIKDVTEQNKQTRLLRKSEEQFRKAFMNIPDAVHINRVSDAVFVDVNDYFLKYTGFTRDEILGKTPDELNVWLDNENSKNYYNRLKIQGFINDLEITFRMKDGSLLDALISSNIIEFNGEPHIITVTRDISKFIAAQEELRRSGEQFRLAFATNPDPVFIQDYPSENFVDMNESFLEYSGFKKEELIGKNPDKLNLWSNQQDKIEIQKHFRENKKLDNLQISLRMKDGRILNGLLSRREIKLDNKPHFLSIIKDITKIKKAQDDLAASEEKFQNIFSKSPDALAIMNVDNWTYLEVNEMFTELSGYSSEEIKGKSTFELNIWTSDEDRAYFSKYLRNQKEIVNRQTIFRQRNGNLIHLLVSAKLFEINDKKYYLLICKDISDFVSLQMALFEKENIFKAIVSNSYEGICIIEDDFKISYVNQKLELITAYSNEEIVDLDFRKIITDGFVDEAGKIYKSGLSIENLPQQFIFDLIRKDGEIRKVEMHSSVINNPDGKPKIIAQIIDVTEREKTAKIIENEHKRALQYFEVAGMMMIVIDLKGNITAINQKGCEILESSPENLVGKNWFNEFIPKNLRTDILEKYNNSMISGTISFPYFENKIKTLSGKEILMAWRNSILKDENDLAIGMISSGEDVSSREEAGRILNLSGMVAVLWKNENGWPIEFISNNAASLLGYEPEDFYSGKIDYEHLIHPDDIERVNLEVKNFTFDKKNKYIHNPYRIIAKNGETKWISDRTTVQFDSEGNISHYYGILSEITEEISKNEKIRQSNEILSQMNDGVIVINFDGQISEWSASASKIFGYNDQEAIGKNLHLIWNEEINVLDKISEILSVIEVLGFYQNEVICLRKDKIEVPIELSAKKLFDASGDPIALVLVNRDISNRKMAQKALEESERRYRHIFESILDGVIIYNMKGNIVEVNKMTIQMYGYGYNEFVQVEAARLIHPVRNHNFEDVVKHLNNDYTKMFEGESVDLSKTGKKFFVNAKGRLIDFKNEPHLLIIVRDITKIKQAEYDLLQAKEKAIESEQLKSAFLANMSHEIRTPMNSIIGFSDLLGDNEISLEEKQHFIRIIRQNGNQLMRIINDIIDISKIEAGQIRLNYELVDICETFDDLYQMFKMLAGDKGLELSKKSVCNENGFLIKTDELRLKQILINLLSNALKFTHQGVIEFGYFVTDNEKSIQFYVKDTGIGIPEIKQKEIFQRFMQAELKTTKLYGGTGLGLAISQGLVQSFKGQIWLESEEGKGSVFNFSIPLLLE